jgi:hypothetical protein
MTAEVAASANLLTMGGAEPGEDALGFVSQYKQGLTAILHRSMADKKSKRFQPVDQPSSR